MLSVTIATCLTRIRRRCDLENDSHVADAELQALLSESVGEMQMEVASAGLMYFKSEATVNLSTFALPSDHLSTIGVGYVYDSAGRRRPLREIMEPERDAWLGRTGDAQVYILNAQTIELFPVPSSGTYKHVYIPQPTDYSDSATSTSIDFVTPDGMAFVVEATCVKALRKSETDIAGFAMARDEAKARLKEWALDRSFMTPRRTGAVGPFGPLGSLSRDPYDPGDWWNR